MKERLTEFLTWLNVGQKKFEQQCGLSNGFVDKVGASIREANLAKISAQYPELNISWLKTGEGDMVRAGGSKAMEADYRGMIYIPLLPIYAQGGSLNDFIVSVKDTECERIVSPIKGADFAINVSGESMYPEFPSGSQILIKKINERAFIDWGKTYVLDTCNGTVIKRIVPSTREGYIKCISINPAPEYAPFEVSLEDVYGIYRVMMCMAAK